MTPLCDTATQLRDACRATEPHSADGRTLCKVRQRSGAEVTAQNRNKNGSRSDTATSDWTGT